MREEAEGESERLNAGQNGMKIEQNRCCCNEYVCNCNWKVETCRVKEYMLFSLHFVAVAVELIWTRHGLIASACTFAV